MLVTLDILTFSGADGDPVCTCTCRYTCVLCISVNVQACTCVFEHVYMYMCMYNKATCKVLVNVYTMYKCMHKSQCHDMYVIVPNTV